MEGSVVRRVWTLVRRFFCRGATVTICSTNASPESNISSVERAIQAHKDFVGTISVLRPILIAPNMGATLESTLTNKRQEQQWIQVAPTYLRHYCHSSLLD